MNVFNIERAFRQKIERKWDFITIAIDLHDTILEGKYTADNAGAHYFPDAVEVLRNWSRRNDIKMILWTSSHAQAVHRDYKAMVEMGIVFSAINVNPFCESTALSDFSQKFYFNILLDDKAGFEGKTDWTLIKNELIKIGEW